MSRKHSSIEFFGEDDCPCPCSVCHQWFDLYDGSPHPRKENEIICSDCATAILIEVEKEEEIEELINQISDAEITIMDAKQRLLDLGYNRDSPGV